MCCISRSSFLDILFLNRIIKIQDGCQSFQITMATKNCLCYFNILKRQVLSYKCPNKLFVWGFYDKYWRLDSKLKVIWPPRAMENAQFLSANFYPRPVMAFGYCRCLRLSVCVCVCVCMCVCVSVNHQFVRTITCHPLKLQSPNLDQKCKTPWLRSLLFLGFIDLDLQGQIELKSQNLPHFGLVSLSGRQVNTKWSEAFQIWTKNAS